MKEKTNIGIWDTITFITLFGILILIGIVLLLIKDLKKRNKVQIKIVHDRAPIKKEITKKPIKKIVKKLAKKK